MDRPGFRVHAIVYAVVISILTLFNLMVVPSSTGLSSHA